MKTGVLRYSYSNNIGDEMQTLAAERFLPRVDMTIERDRLHWYGDDGPILVPFNGWFTRPSYDACWPPPENIIPLLHSFYAVVPESLINARTADFFRRHQPIGCRSLPTIAHFERLGIEAYHSGCLTLTLPESTEERGDEVVIVDANPELVKKCVPARILEKARFVTHLTPSGEFGGETGVSLADVYSKTWNRLDRNRRFGKGHREALLQARHERRMTMIRERLALYAKARLVITGLLHCSMPCLALGTPVVLLKPDLAANPRFDGLKELVRYRSSGAEPIDIDWDRPEPNGGLHQKMAATLESTLSSLIRQHLD